MSSDLRIAFIGGGNMAAALGAGLAGKLCPADHIHVVDINEDIRARWQGLGSTAAASADETLRSCNVWIYAVKPQVMAQVVEATRPWLAPGTLVISIAAGITLARFEQWLAGAQALRLVRCMPNTPALVGAGASGLYASAAVPQAQRDLATSILAAVGTVTWVEQEAQLDAVTALSGSGPAYIFLLIEALTAGGERLGLVQADAQALAIQTVLGAAQLAAASSETPAVLRQRVTSPGGTTAAALQVFEQREWPAIVADAMAAAARRAEELSQGS
ncbi:pyrroline-5-carboxylate reductase [Kerstersia similis]|uniref:pyrroline-5-carboxylate reductase n=1 Tax=Kerstersia similis TaxID=206505 RepID=UPI0039EF32B5